MSLTRKVIPWVIGIATVITLFLIGRTWEWPLIGIIPWVFVTVVLAALIIAVLGGYVLEWSWTGFRVSDRRKPQTKDGGETKKLWDWLDLLIIPAVLVVGGLLFSLAQEERQRLEERAQDARQQLSTEQSAKDATLQAYLDETSKLLLGNLSNSEEGGQVVTLAQASTQEDIEVITLNGPEIATLVRARTLTVLDRLGRDFDPSTEEYELPIPDHRRSVVQFLHDAGLIKVIRQKSTGRIVKEKSIIDLTGAELKNINLSSLNLGDIVLNNTNLSCANLNNGGLSGAYLGGANLSGVDLKGADLTGALLGDADLTGADLRGADRLSSTELGGANLTGTDIRGTDLRYTKGLTQRQIEEAIGNAQTHLPDGLEYPVTWAESPKEQTRSGCKRSTAA